MIFISHDFDDRSDFDNLTDALEAAGVPYFKPSDMRAGASLRDKLREAIQSCSGCIFIATRNSLSSSWCQAEIGAFWGLGKPVCIWVADKEIEDGDIPSQFKGDLWTKRILKIVEAAKEYEMEGDPSRRTPIVADLDVDEFARLIRQAIPSGHSSGTAVAEKEFDGGADPSRKPRPVVQLDENEFYQLVREATPQATESHRELLQRIRASSLLLAEKKLLHQSEQSRKELRLALEDLIGLDYGRIDTISKDIWPWVGSAEGSSGRWSIYSNENEAGPGREVYKDGCLLLTAREGLITSAGVAWWVGGSFDSPGISDFALFVGKDDFGPVSSVL